MTGASETRVEGDCSERQHQYPEALPSGPVCQTGQQMRRAYSDTAKEHKAAAPKAIDQQHRDDRKSQVDCPGDHNIEHDIADAIAGAAIDLGSVVEDDVYTTPLLQHSKANADQQKATQRAGEQGPNLPGFNRGYETIFGSKSVQRLRNGGLLIEVEDSKGLLLFIVLNQPARTLGNKGSEHKKEQGGNSDGCEHPSPAILRHSTKPK